MRLQLLPASSLQPPNHSASVHLAQKARYASKWLRREDSNSTLLQNKIQEHILRCLHFVLPLLFRNGPPLVFVECCPVSWNATARRIQLTVHVFACVPAQLTEMLHASQLHEVSVLYRRESSHAHTRNVVPDLALNWLLSAINQYPYAPSRCILLENWQIKRGFYWPLKEESNNSSHLSSQLVCMPVTRVIGVFFCAEKNRKIIFFFFFFFFLHFFTKTLGRHKNTENKNKDMKMRKSTAFPERSIKEKVELRPFVIVYPERFSPRLQFPRFFVFLKSVLKSLSFQAFFNWFPFLSSEGEIFSRRRLATWGTYCLFLPFDIGIFIASWWVFHCGCQSGKEDWECLILCFSRSLVGHTKGKLHHCLGSESRLHNKGTEQFAANILFRPTSKEEEETHTHTHIHHTHTRQASIIYHQKQKIYLPKKLPLSQKKKKNNNNNNNTKTETKTKQIKQTNKQKTGCCWWLSNLAPSVENKTSSAAPLQEALTIRRSKGSFHSFILFVLENASKCSQFQFERSEHFNAYLFRNGKYICTNHRELAQKWIIFGLFRRVSFLLPREGFP